MGKLNWPVITVMFIVFILGLFHSSSFACGCIDEVGSKGTTTTFPEMKWNQLEYKIASLFLIGMIGVIIVLTVSLTFRSWRSSSKREEV